MTLVLRRYLQVCWTLETWSQDSICDTMSPVRHDCALTNSESDTAAVSLVTTVASSISNNILVLLRCSQARRKIIFDMQQFKWSQITWNPGQKLLYIHMFHNEITWSDRYSLLNCIYAHIGAPKGECHDLFFKFRCKIVQSEAIVIHKNSRHFWQFLWA